MIKRICYRCLQVGEPIRLYSSSAGVWYLGCINCKCGVFFGGKS